MPSCPLMLYQENNLQSNEDLIVKHTSMHTVLLVFSDEQP